MKRIKNIGSVIAVAIVSSVFIFAMQKGPSETETESVKATEQPVVNNGYNVYALDVPKDLNFAGEPLPLNNPDIYERMDRELLVNTYWQSNGLLMFKRAQKYFSIIEPILKKNGIPDDFKYLSVIESGLTNAVSPAGARGFWQIMPVTGRENGLEINKNVDERYNLEMATEVACKYLNEAKAKFGNWTLAAASYNAGKAGIARRLKDQNVNDYYDLLLGEETGRYMFRIVALKEILNNAKKYGFNFEDKHLYKYVPTTKVKVNYPVEDFTKFAEKYGINYKILKIHNPWLREPHLNNKSKKMYEIAIPQEGFYE